jgi:hypothetical protein
MARIRISQVIDRTPSEVWNEMRHIERHVNWMHDAVEIRFISDSREGIGTSFICLTKVGPFKTQDAMTITEWRENEAMGVKHVGLVKGFGVFTIVPVRNGSLVAWQEDLLFPWWALGRIGSLLIRPLLKRIWSKNLKTLKSIIEI